MKKWKALNKSRVAFYLAFFVLLWIKIVWAGPPFITDDPPPVEYLHWQLYLFANLNKNHFGTLLSAPAFEADYGLAPNLEINFIAPMATNFQSNGGGNSFGLSDFQLGFKYRFIQETTYIPQVSFAPIYFLPAGNSNKGLGNGHNWEILPIWFQKSWNDWTTYAGGGYALNSAPSTNNFYFGGWVLQKNINDKWMLGAELYSQGAFSYLIPAYTIINLGGSYQIKNNLALLFSAGNNIAGASNVVSYLGLNWFF